MAVLVPRRAIAEGLSKHVSASRGGLLGEEVGLGMGGTVAFTPASRIVFMTYGFFMGLNINSQHFARYVQLVERTCSGHAICTYAKLPSNVCFSVNTDLPSVVMSSAAPLTFWSFAHQALPLMPLAMLQTIKPETRSARSMQISTCSIYIPYVRQHDIATGSATC